MTRLPLAAALCGVLLAGCAALDSTPGGESELVAEVRQTLSTDPQLNAGQVTVTERDGVIVLNGFADSLEDLDAIGEAIEGVDGVASIENNVIVRTN